MYRAPSPFNPEHQQRAQPFSGQIAPGQITYTTSTDADGRVIYHPFRAVAASYPTPTGAVFPFLSIEYILSFSGVVTGIQWVPSDAVTSLPAGAQPANAEFAASWSRTGITKEEQKALKDWQNKEEKRRKKEEKEAKRQREKSGQAYGDADNELRKARERDAQAMASRERRKSFNQGGGAGGVAFPTSGATSGGYAMGAMGAGGYPSANPGYPATPYTAGYNGVPASTGYEQRDRKYSTGGGLSELDRQLGDLDLDRNREYGERERKISGMSRPKYQTEAERTRKVSGNFGERPPFQTTGSYGSAYPNAYPAQTAGNPYYTPGHPSPSMRPGESPQVTFASAAYANPNYPAAGAPMPRPTTPYGGGGAPLYPPGHVLEGKPVHGTTPPTNAGYPPFAAGAGYPPFGAGVQMTDPNAADQGQLAAPDGFSRPINAAQAFTAFEKMKVQDMDDLVHNAPRMPAVLSTHDVYPSDWNRMMQDLCLAWTGRLPAPGRAQKKTTLAADLIDLWNFSFFFSRGVEVVLYKGRERRSGPSAGLVDIHYDENDDESSSSSSSSDSESDDGDRYPPATYMYGQQQFAPGQGPMADVLNQRQRRREMKAEKKRRRKEKKAKRKAKAKEKKYALYLTCVANGAPAAGSVSGGMPAMGAMGMPGTGMPGAYNAAPVGYGPASGAYAGGPAPGAYAGGPSPGAYAGGPSPAAYGGIPASAYGGGVPAGYGAVAGGMPMTNQSGGY
ncbi:hypothetical protein C8F04DRAFT_16395 [Mycena alexandri]|uniref:Uncharacterized protein n=1 Tax=Mycena alexandri TaxID=1745969 RepID=A0AAD6TNZ3_9AGAR|nr:hypothetical protein C8F04DRAFT_16395 [Mycena alexandri]